MLNSAGNNSFSDLVSVYLKGVLPLNLEFFIFRGIQQVLNFDFLKFRILEIELSPIFSADCVHDRETTGDHESASRDTTGEVVFLFYEN